MKNNGCLSVEENKRIGLFSQLNIERCPVELLEAALRETRKRNKSKEKKK